MTWEVVTATIVAFIIMEVTGVEQRVVEKWLYVETGLFLFTGIVGTGYHYYWICAPITGSDGAEYSAHLNRSDRIDGD